MTFITFCSHCGMGCKIPRVDPQMTLFQLFYPLVRITNSTSKQYLFSLGSWKKIYFGHSSKKVIIPAPFHSKMFALLYKSETSWELHVLGRLSRSFFSPSQGPLILKIRFSWPFLELAGYRLQLCESFVVVSPILYLAFFKTILAAVCRNLHFSMIILPLNIRIFPVF